MFRRKRTYTDRTDEELMELVAGGDSSAFDELYGRYARRLLYYFHRMLGGNEAMAQDALHDLFLKLVERPELYAGGRSFSTWIFSVANNMCKNEYRRLEVRARGMTGIEPDELSSADESVIERLDRESFKRALDMELDGFAPELRATFLLRYHEDLSLQEIGEILDCPVGTVKSRLFNMARKLAGRLGEYQPNDHGLEQKRLW